MQKDHEMDNAMITKKKRGGGKTGDWNIMKLKKQGNERDLNRNDR